MIRVQQKQPALPQPGNKLRFSPTGVVGSGLGHNEQGDEGAWEAGWMGGAGAGMMVGFICSRRVYEQKAKVPV